MGDCAVGACACSLHTRSPFRSLCLFRGSAVGVASLGDDQPTVEDAQAVGRVEASERRVPAADGEEALPVELERRDAIRLVPGSSGAGHGGCRMEEFGRAGTSRFVG